MLRTPHGRNGSAVMWRRKLNLKETFECSSSYTVSIAEAVGAFNTGFDGARLHRPTVKDTVRSTCPTRTDASPPAAAAAAAAAVGVDGGFRRGGGRSVAAALEALEALEASEGWTAAATVANGRDRPRTTGGSAIRSSSCRSSVSGAGL